MKKEVQQQQPYGCGVYAVANSLFIPSFITEERIEASKNGNAMFQLNEWLKEDGIKFRVESYFFDMENTDPLRPSKVIDSEQDDENIYCALIQVKQSKESKWHIVAAEITSKGLLIIKDSCKQEYISCFWTNILDHYYQVVGLFLFDGVNNHLEKAVVIRKQN
jgi:hypothetical protein